MTQLNLHESMAMTDLHILLQFCIIFARESVHIELFRAARARTMTHMLSQAARMMEEEGDGAVAVVVEEEEEEEEEEGRGKRCRHRTLAPLVATWAALPAPPLQRESHTVMHPWRKKKIRG